MRRFGFRLYFLMLDGERSIVSGHLSEMLSGNWVARPFGTFFKHASAFHKVLGDGHWHLLAGESNRIQSMRPGFYPGLKRFLPACRVCAGGLIIHAISFANQLNCRALLSVRRRVGLIAHEFKARRFTPGARLTSVGATRPEASVQGPWTSWDLHTRQGS